MKIIGIDPGKNGAIAVLSLHHSKLNFVSVESVPLNNGGRDYNVGHMRKMVLSLVYEEKRLWAPHKAPVILAAIESQHAFPGQGGVGNFSLGYGYGLWMMAIQHEAIDITILPPVVWRKFIFGHSMAKELRKKASLEKARELFPYARPYLERLKDDGRAEALLIAKTVGEQLCQANP